MERRALVALTEDGKRIVDEIAARHGFSSGAALTILDALIAGGGTQAQFNHPDLGGMGQWSHGGMVMIGDMFNHDLKSRVDRFCSDLARALADDPGFAAQPNASQWQRQSSVETPGVGTWTSEPGHAPWPEELGAPSAAGSQNGMRYAVFPGKRRLAIEKAGKVTVYDTGEHRIGGVSQQQSAHQVLTFMSQDGPVRVEDLAVAGTDPAVVPASADGVSQARAVQDHDDVFAKLERLAELRDKGIVTAEELEAKKAELLARL